MTVTGAAAAGIERVLIRPFDPADHLPLVIISLGLLPAVNAVAGIVWRFDPRELPELFPSGTAFTWGVATLTWYTIFTVITVVVVLVVLHLLMTGTKIGLAFRAVSSNLESSRLVGIRVGPTLQFGWAPAAAVGAVVGGLVIGFDWASSTQSLGPVPQRRLQGPTGSLFLGIMLVLLTFFLPDGIVAAGRRLKARLVTIVPVGPAGPSVEHDNTPPAGGEP